MISVKILQKCDETSLTVTGIDVSSEKWPLHVSKLSPVHTIQFLQPISKYKKVRHSNHHFYELKQCQENNRIQKVDRVNRPLASLIVFILHKEAFHVTLFILATSYQLIVLLSKIYHSNNHACPTTFFTFLFNSLP